jgi:predicted lipoprotein with Yx(FWY)xxD motif
MKELQMRRLVLPFVLLALAAALSASALAARETTGPVVKWKSASLGQILATPGHLALYTWNQEKSLKVKCTGACAKTWPPLTIPHGTMAPKHIAGAMGTFGEVMRPDGTTQITYNGHPLYRFHGDTSTKILCNGVGGWYVVKVH